MPTIPSPRFYVYVLARPNQRPFYVGKGQRGRVFDHEAEARRGCECHKCRVIRKIWRHGGEVQRYIVFTTDDEEAAYRVECEYIVLYGRTSLANHVDGGRGGGGFKPSTRPRAKIRAGIRAAGKYRQSRTLDIAERWHNVEWVSTNCTWQLYRCVECPICESRWSLAPACCYDGAWYIACPWCGVLPWRALFREAARGRVLLKR